MLRNSRGMLLAAPGFPFRYVDPWTGKVAAVYICSETNRGFQSVKGTVQRSEWKDASFVNLVSPPLKLRTDEHRWYLRTLRTLDYGLGEFGDKGRRKDR